jgi:lipid-A-disaccharide synthase
MSARRLYLVAAEPSGDAIAGDLIDALRRSWPDIELAGVGGTEMAKRGVQSLFDVSELSVFGLFDGLKIANLVHQRAEQLAEHAKAFGAEGVVLIDSWGFMLRVAWKLEELLPDVPRIKYVAPQVFASRQGRAKVAAEHFDHLLAIHPFDAPYFEPYGLPVDFVGNPALERDMSGDGVEFLRRHGLSDLEPTLLVLFGSRPAELRRLFRPFVNALHKVKLAIPDIQLVTVLAPALEAQARELIDDVPGLSDHLVIVGSDERADAFSASDLALACSGTVTLELARLGIPTIAAYRLGWMAWAAARLWMMKAKYISLANLAADEMLIPEYVQTRCTADNLATEIQSMLDDPQHLADIGDRLTAVTHEMAGQGGSPSQNAANAIMKTLNT